MPKVIPISASAKKESASLMLVLNNLMEKNGLTMAQLSKNTGLAFTTIKRICTDPNCNTTLKSIEIICEFFGIHQMQLLGFEPINFEGNSYKPNFSAWSNVPIISLQQLKKWPNNIDEILASEKTQFIKTDYEVNEKTFALKAMDETLEPKFSNGAILIFDSEKEYKNKDYVVMLSSEKELPQIRQIFLDGSDLYTKTINPEFGSHPKKLEKKSFSILGVLIQAKMNYF